MLVQDVATFGQAVRAARRRHKMSQTELALVAGVGPRFVVELENGKETARIGLILRVLQALGIQLTACGPGLDIEGDTTSGSSAPSRCATAKSGQAPRGHDAAERASE